MKSERIHLLNNIPIREGKYILYRMQASQRIKCNLALCEAAHLANDNRLPLLILFHLKIDYPEANYRHFKFMIEGLMECVKQARQLGIGFELTDLPEEQLFTAFYADAAAIVCDKGYLRHQRKWNTDIAHNTPCLVEEVEDNLIIPIASTSGKKEWSAHTIRHKLTEKTAYFANDGKTSIPILTHPYPVATDHNPEIAERVLDKIRQKAYLSPVAMTGGEKAALNMLEEFIHTRIPQYSTNRNNPSLGIGSHLSPYLHFGQISPLQIIQRIRKLPETETFIEQLLVRRELCYNFIHYTPNYDSYEGLPQWCRQTLDAHRSDPRPRIYSTDELEHAQTDDSYWNAAMNEMLKTGYMENSMRMYWGKKIIEWSATPEEAYTTALCLNNRYFLDGRDANSYAGVGWCFGLHDRPWPSHPVFGSIRIMTAAGLKRKYNMDDYCRKFL